jgi:hypothetical protein
MTENFHQQCQFNLVFETFMVHNIVDQSCISNNLYQLVRLLKTISVTVKNGKQIYHVRKNIK